MIDVILQNTINLPSFYKSSVKRPNGGFCDISEKVQPYKPTWGSDLIFNSFIRSRFNTIRDVGESLSLEK